MSATGRQPHDGADLRLQDVSISFGGINAVSNLSLEVAPGQITSLIGPNGAGKTTVLNAISGFCPCKRGSIRYDGVELVGQPPWHRPNLGIARTFQNLQLFGSLSVLENVMVGSHVSQRGGFLASMAYWGRERAEEQRVIDEAMVQLERVGLAGLYRMPAASLPFAGQRLLALARALVASPRLLLLDEPAAGIQGDTLLEFVGLIRSLCEEQKLSVLLVDHHMELVMRLSDQIAVMHQGTLLTEGTPSTIRAHPDVISVYLGTGTGEVKELVAADG